MADFETVTVETDLLLCGGGMAACGAAVEASYWAKKNGLKVTLVDKAAMDRSGAVAMGLSAINQYVDLNSGNNTLTDYCDYVRNDLNVRAPRTMAGLFSGTPAAIRPNRRLPSSVSISTSQPVSMWNR